MSGEVMKICQTCGRLVPLGGDCVECAELEPLVDRLKRNLDHMDEYNEIEIVMDREGLEECIEALALRTLRDAGDAHVDKLFIDAMHAIGVDESVNPEGCRSSQKSLEELHCAAITRGQQLREARAEIERLKGDADRYRWLRSHSWHEPYHIFFGPGCNQTEPWHLDQAIDNEMKYPIIEGEQT